MEALNLKQSPETIIVEDADGVATSACNTGSLLRPEMFPVLRGRRQHRVFRSDWQLTRRVTGSWESPSMVLQSAMRRPNGDCDIARRGGLAMKSGNADRVKLLTHSVPCTRKHRPHPMEGKR